MNSNNIDEIIDNDLIKNNCDLNANLYELKNISINNNNNSISEQIDLINKKFKNKNLLSMEDQEKSHFISSSSCDNLKVRIPKINDEINTKIKRDKSQIMKIDKPKNPKKNSYNILVAVRCRPLNKKEKEISEKETVTIIDQKIIKLKDPNGFLNPNNIRAKEKILTYDFAFNSLVTQEQIFNCTIKTLINDILNGYNATVFAYGATGAGKTYTMLGNDDNPGIMILTLRELFRSILLYQNRNYIIKLWYIEIYNENIRDLLANNNENLELREDPNKGIIINNVTEIITNSSEDILNLLKMGNKNRTTEETNANEASSRSHAILNIMVSYKEKDLNENKEIKYAKLNLIDLAGSERASVTKNKGMRLIEGANINKSLLTLGNCINALSEKSEKGSKIYIPYRDSKLTRLLKDSLGGNSRTIMIANISPFIYNFDDTYNTLKYAERAKCIKTKVKLNILEKNQVDNYLDTIKNLQNKIIFLQNQLNYKNINQYNSNRFERMHSSSPKQICSEKKEKRKFYFDDNFLNFNEIDKLAGVEAKNIKENDNNKKNKYRFRKKSKEQREQRTKGENDFLIDDDLDEFLVEKDKRISLIIEDYIQQSEAEIQLKQKIINIQYNMILLYNKLKENEASNKKNTSEDRTRLKNLKKILDKNVETLKEISIRNENFIKKCIENNNKINEDEEIELNYLQKQYIYTIFKNTKIEKENIEIKYKYTIFKHDYEKKINYIKELEKQVKLRDLIIKELLSLDTSLPNNIKPANNNKYQNQEILSNLLKNNTKYKTLSEAKNKATANKKKDKRGKRNDTSGLNRPRSISINNKINIPRKKLFNQKTESNNYNINDYEEEEDFIIDFDKDGSKLNISNLDVGTKIQSVTRSNSSFNIYNFKQDLNNMNNIHNIKIVGKSQNQKGHLMSNCSTQKFLNESNNSYINRNTEEINDSSNKIKSMIKEIKNINTDISSKFSVIEQQSNRNIFGLSGQISNQKIKEKEKEFIAKCLNADKNEKADNSFNKKNDNNNKDNIINLKENLTNENDNKNNKYKNSFTINCRIVNNNITNRKNKENKNNSNINLIRSENYKKNCIKIFDSQTSKNTLEKVILSQGKSKSKSKITNNNNQEINKNDINNFKHRSITKNLNHNNNNKSYLSSSSQKKNSCQKKSEERNKSMNNRIPNSNKKEINNLKCLNERISNIAIENRVVSDDKVPFIDDKEDSQFTLGEVRINLKNISKRNNNFNAELNNDEINKNNKQNSRHKSFNFKKKSSKEKISNDKLNNIKQI